MIQSFRSLARSAAVPRLTGRPSAVVAVSLLILVALAVSVARAEAGVADFQIVFLLAAVIANLAVFPLWATQWSLLLPAGSRISWRGMFAIAALGSSAKVLVPYGDYPCVLVLLTGYGRLSRTAALSLMGLDQLSTGVAKLSVVVLAFAVGPLPQAVKTGAVSLAFGLVLLLIVLIALSHGNRHWLAAVLPRRAARWRRSVAQWTLSLEALRNWRVAIPVVALAIAKKALEAVAVLAIQRSCGIPLSVEATIVIVAALSVTTLLPALPANAGTYEVTVVFVYQWAGVPGTQALTAALLQHVAWLVPAFGCGAGVLLLRACAEFQSRARSKPAGSS